MIFELGYTPANLRKIIDDHNLLQKQVYEYIGKSRAAFERYLLNPGDPKFVSMHHNDWLKVLEYVQVHSLSHNT